MRAPAVRAGRRGRAMPITVRCPNPACGQTLSVQDEYAGMQGKCPLCGTLVTFPAAAPALPVIPIAPTPPSERSPVMAGPPPLDGAPPPAPATAPGPRNLPAFLSGFDQLALITLPTGLFFLFLLALSTVLPWLGFEMGPS